MDAEGVTVRPLRQISGDAHFNEVFLDDVRLEEDATVGPVDGGWGVAMTTLMFERVAIGLGGEGFGWRADRFATALVEDDAATRDREVRHRFGAIAAEFLALRFTSYRMLTTVQRGGVPGPEGALAKVTTVRAAIAAGDLLVDSLGPGALDEERHGRLVSDMPGIKSAGGTEEILRSMVGERVLGLPPEPRLDKGVPFAELRARERAAAAVGMNLALTDEQELLKEAARGALSRVKTVEAAREALDGAALPDLWPTAVETGWTGLLVCEERGGAGLGVLDAMLVFSELGRVLAAVPLLGHLPATLAARRRGGRRARGAGGRRAARHVRRRQAAVGDRGDLDGRRALRAAPGPRAGDRRRDRDRRGRLGARRARAPTCSSWWAPTAAPPPCRRATRRSSPWRATTPPARSAHVRFDGAAARVLALPADAAATAWYVAQALLAAEAIGAVELALETSVQYAKERFTFGRAIGSYQAVKHELVEILRRLENARSLMYYAGWAAQDAPAELPVAASAFRLVGWEALDHASRAQISVHGGIGATWEHDAPLYFRRAQRRGGCWAARVTRPTASPTSCSRKRGQRCSMISPAAGPDMDGGCGPTTGGASRSPGTSSRSASTGCCGSG